jgi:glucan 1,3-beta-glucosidase
MLKVGEPGQTGSVEIADFMFSTKGAQPGAILVQWNLKGSAPGAAGMWDAHFRVGGFAGSELQVPQCPKGQSAVPQCNGAHTLLHITATGSAYMENVWAWTGDHDLDNQLAQGQISIYTGRGVLVESNPGPVWLYGIQSEHNVLYQYQLNNARNVYMTMIQSETPYWQPGPPAPQPFNPSTTFDDPTYAHCNGRLQCEMSYSIIAKRSSNVYLYGAGMYNFFFDYSQTCLDQENCQDNMVNLEGNTNFYMFNANTKASVNMVVRNNNEVLARQTDNKNGFCQSINAFLVEA